MGASVRSPCYQVTWFIQHHMKWYSPQRTKVRVANVMQAFLHASVLAAVNLVAAYHV